MKKIMAVLLGLALVVLGGCVSLNIAGAGNVGDMNLGANVDPINGNVGADAGRSVRVGDTETSVGVATNGGDADVNTNTQYNPNNGQ